MAETGAFVGYPNLTRQAAKLRKAAAGRDVNSLPDPRTYAFVSGLLGEAPGEQGFSVLHPDAAGIRKAADAGYVGGLLAMAAPATKGVKPVAQALAPKAADMAENYLVRTGLAAPIVPPETARRIRMETRIPSAAEFAPAVQNTAGARLSDDGLLLAVRRNQVPFQAGEDSVRGGVFYLPAGDKRMSFYKGAAGYGGDQPLSGETLLRAPMFVKGATGGKAPEAALDQVAGKGAYKAAREDALAVLRFPGNPWDRERRVEAVEAYLQQYAPDLSGRGEYIVRNSPKGNQLPFALQEAAVSQAVRGAGYDSVLGYGKGKNGPFLSEVFDVREATYPTPEGGFSLFPRYLLD